MWNKSVTCLISQLCFFLALFVWLLRLTLLLFVPLFLVQTPFFTNVSLFSLSSFSRSFDSSSYFSTFLLFLPPLHNVATIMLISSSPSSLPLILYGSSSPAQISPYVLFTPPPLHVCVTSWMFLLMLQQFWYNFMFSEERNKCTWASSSETQPTCSVLEEERK